MATAFNFIFLMAENEKFGRVVSFIHYSPALGLPARAYLLGSPARGLPARAHLLGSPARLT